MDLSRRNDELLGQLEDVAIFAAGTPVRSGLEDAEIGAADADVELQTLRGAAPSMGPDHLLSDLRDEILGLQQKIAEYGNHDAVANGGHADAWLEEGDERSPQGEQRHSVPRHSKSSGKGLRASKSSNKGMLSSLGIRSSKSSDKWARTRSQSSETPSEIARFLDSPRSPSGLEAVLRVSVQRIDHSVRALRAESDEAHTNGWRHNNNHHNESFKSGKSGKSGKSSTSEQRTGIVFQEAPQDGLTEVQAQQLLRKWGKNELAEEVTPKWLVFMRLLWGPMPVMLWIASLIEAVIGNYADMAILLAIQFANASISFYETTKAGDAVAALKASLKPKATVKRDGVWAEIDATLVVPGDRVLLAAGSAVPADCYVNEGLIEIDQSAMTGESLPVKFHRGDVCKLGSNVVRGETEGTVETTGSHTFFGKTATMLQSVSNEGGSLQTLLLRVMGILVALSMTLCVTALIYLIAAGRVSNSLRPEIHQRHDREIIKESLSFAVCVLVASIPLAIEIVTTTTLALGSKSLSAKGAIVTRLGSIEEMAGMDCLCSDKTGTLTLNKVCVPTFGFQDCSSGAIESSW